MKDQISALFAHKDVDTDKNHISLLELQTIINNAVKPYKSILNNELVFVNKFNQNLKQAVESPNYDLDINPNYLKKFKFDNMSIVPGFNRSYVSLFLHRNRGLKRAHHYMAVVNKNDEDEIEISHIEPYYTSNTSSIKTIVDFSKDILKTIITTVEQYQSFINDVSQIPTINTELFSYTLYFEENNIQIKVLPNCDAMDMEVYYKEYDNEVTIDEFVKANKDLLLWATQIDINTLPESLIDLIKKDKENEFVLAKRK